MGHMLPLNIISPVQSGMGHSQLRRTGRTYVSVTLGFSLNKRDGP